MEHVRLIVLLKNYFGLLLWQFTTFQVDLVSKPPKKSGNTVTRYQLGRAYFEGRAYENDCRNSDSVRFKWK